MVLAIVLALALPAPELVIQAPASYEVVERRSVLPPVLKIESITPETYQVSERIVLQPRQTKIGSQKEVLFNLRNPPVARSAPL